MSKATEPTQSDATLEELKKRRQELIESMPIAKKPSESWGMYTKHTNEKLQESWKQLGVDVNGNKLDDVIKRENEEEEISYKAQAGEKARREYLELLANQSKENEALSKEMFGEDLAAFWKDNPHVTATVSTPAVSKPSKVPIFTISDADRRRAALRKSVPGVYKKLQEGDFKGAVQLVEQRKEANEAEIKKIDDFLNRAGDPHNLEKQCRHSTIHLFKRELQNQNEFFTNQIKIVGKIELYTSTQESLAKISKSIKR